MKTLLRVILALVALAAIVVVGGYFAMKRDDIPYATLEQEYANPADKFIDLPSGARAHYRIQGKADGRTLVLIHGFGVNLETWEPWVKELGGEYRLISVDLPGYGLTRTPDGYKTSIAGFADFIDEFAGAIGLTRFTAVGNSMGGNTAWVLALRHPARVDALVLIDASGWRDDARAGPPPLVFQLLNNRMLAPRLADIDPKPLVKSGLEAAVVNKAYVTDAMVTRYADFVRAPGHRQMIVARRPGGDTDAVASKEKLAAIGVPTLILWGDQDKLVPPADAQKFADAIKGSKLIMYKNIGHIPHEELAAQSASDLKTFLTDQTLAGAALATLPPPKKP